MTKKKIITQKETEEALRLIYAEAERKAQVVKQKAEANRAKKMEYIRHMILEIFFQKVENFCDDLFRLNKTNLKKTLEGITLYEPSEEAKKKIEELEQKLKEANSKPKAKPADATQGADTEKVEQLQKDLDTARAEIEKLTKENGELKANQGQPAELSEEQERDICHKYISRLILLHCPKNNGNMGRIGNHIVYFSYKPK